MGEQPTSDPLAILKDKKTWMALGAAVLAAILAWATGLFGGKTPAPATPAPATAPATPTPTEAPAPK
jgi:hypothetical protein